jgi:hypothetical protein
MGLIMQLRRTAISRVQPLRIHTVQPRRARTMFLGSNGFGPDGQPAKVGATTYVAWGLCGVLLAGCWAWEWYDGQNRVPDATLPDDVERKLENGAYLMRDGSIRKELPTK